jgi:hypothetical protein
MLESDNPVVECPPSIMKKGLLKRFAWLLPSCPMEGDVQVQLDGHSPEVRSYCQRTLWQ